MPRQLTMDNITDDEIEELLAFVRLIALCADTSEDIEDVYRTFRAIVREARNLLHKD